MATVPMLPGAVYQVVGIVTASDNDLKGHATIEDRLAELEKQAVTLGANAVIGIQMATCNAKYSKGIVVKADSTVTTLIGTAIKIT